MVILTMKTYNDNAMKTHGERWRDATARRIDAYCKARGWRSGYPILTVSSMMRIQYMVEVLDRFGHAGEVAFEGESLIDDYGRAVDVTADNFDSLIAPYNLAPKQYIPKRQLRFVFSPTF